MTRSMHGAAMLEVSDIVGIIKIKYESVRIFVQTILCQETAIIFRGEDMTVSDELIDNC